MSTTYVFLGGPAAYGVEDKRELGGMDVQPALPQSDFRNSTVVNAKLIGESHTCTITSFCR